MAEFRNKSRLSWHVLQDLQHNCLFKKGSLCNTIVVSFILCGVTIEHGLKVD